MRIRPDYGWIVAMHTVVDPVYLFCCTASLIKDFGSAMYFRGYLVASY